MLDSLVRVSRRVGGIADLLATEWRAAPAKTLTAELSSVPAEQGARQRGLRTPKRTETSPRSVVLVQRFVACESREVRPEIAAQRPAESLRIPAQTPATVSQPESRLPTSRLPPFTSTQFHVLLNSLFKVLFNFPSRYLFAIGLEVIFSLTRSLPRTLSCTPKQLDSGEEACFARVPPYGPITLYGPWPLSRWTWADRKAARRLSQTPHAARPRGPAVRCWAPPVSFAITKGITVVFFSSAY